MTVAEIVTPQTVATLPQYVASGVRVVRDNSAGWSATVNVEIPGLQRDGMHALLKITVARMIWGDGVLRSQAAVVWCDKHFTRSMPRGDWYLELARRKIPRVTSKVVEEEMRKHLPMIPVLVAQAIAFYAAKASS